MDNGISNETQESFLNDFNNMMNHEIMNEFDTTNVSKLIDTYETFQTETEDDAVDMTRITNRIGESSLIVYEVLM